MISIVISANIQCYIIYNQYFYYSMDVHLKPKRQSNFIQRFKGKTNILPKQGIQAMLSRQFEKKMDFHVDHSKIKKSDATQNPQKHTDLRYHIQKLKSIKASSMDLKSKQSISNELENYNHYKDPKKIKINSHRESFETQNTPIKLPKINKTSSKNSLPRLTQNNGIQKSASLIYSNKRASSETDFKKIISLDKNAHMQLELLNLIEQKFNQMKSKGQINEKLLFHKSRKNN